MISFKNKKILITGATGGIGNELVKKFLNLGGNVVATGTKAEKLDIIKKKYPNVKVKKFDLETNYFKKKEFYDKSKMNKINFAETETQPITREKSFVYSFLSSVRQKINSPTKNKHRNPN